MPLKKANDIQSDVGTDRDLSEKKFPTMFFHPIIRELHAKYKQEMQGTEIYFI